MEGKNTFLRSHRQENSNALPESALAAYNILRENVLLDELSAGPSFVAAETTKSQDEDMMEDSLGESFDLSRLPPRIFTGLRKSRMAIRGEIFNLLKTHNGLPAAVGIIDLSLGRYRRVEKIRTTLVVKIKAGHRHKARMCLRGDHESLIQSSFPSAPTIYKELVKLGLSTFANMENVLRANVDISQAFLQSGVLPIASQIIAYPPECVFLDDKEWSGAIFPSSKDDSVEDLVRKPWSEKGWILTVKTLNMLL